jgi:hypothetical protein
VYVLFGGVRLLSLDSGHRMSYLITREVLKKESDCAAPNKSASIWPPENLLGIRDY